MVDDFKKQMNASAKTIESVADDGGLLFAITSNLALIGDLNV